MGKAGGTGRLIAGAMSGTSADGVDVALVRVTGRGFEMRADLVHHHADPYDAALRARIFAVRETQACSLREFTSLARDIALAYARAVTAALRAARVDAADLDAVAAHGQTLFHDPPLTLQLIDSALLAAEVGAAVVSDFRRADCAAGGQGAPLVPFADYVLFRDPTTVRVLLNLGGIANITVLRPGGTPADVVAFDTGPANCIADHVVRTRGPAGNPGYDADGALAATGRVLEPLLADFVDTCGYLRRPPPKSTDGPAMLAAYIAARSRYVASHGEPSIGDELRTACAITADTVWSAVTRARAGPLSGPAPVDLIVSGGGAANPVLMAALRHRCASHGARLRTSDDLGMPAAAKEAVAFALLAAATLDGVPANVPSVTGAAHAVVLGAVTPRPR